MRTFASVCAVALAASSADAKIPAPFVQQDSNFSPEGFEYALPTAFSLLNLPSHLASPV